MFSKEAGLYGPKVSKGCTDTKDTFSMEKETGGKSGHSLCLKSFDIIIKLQTQPGL